MGTIKYDSQVVIMLDTTYKIFSDIVDTLRLLLLLFLIFFNFLFIYDSHTEREREAEIQAEGEAGSMHREPDVGIDPRSPGSRPGPKAGAKPLRHPGIPSEQFLISLLIYSLTYGLFRSL